MLLRIGGRGHDLAPLRGARLPPRLRDALLAELAFEPDARPRGGSALAEALATALDAQD
jgi:hypothetical protein